MRQASRFRLKFLGAPSIIVNGRPVNIGSNKATALLAYLASNRAPLNRSELDAMFWPEADFERARRSLREELSRLCHYLPAGVLHFSGQQVSLEPDTDIDIWNFEHALAEQAWERAATLYAGELLEGLFVRNAASFESWLAAERESLQSSYTQVLQELSNKAAHAGDIGAALAYHQQIVATNPLMEGAYLQAMKLARQLGETAVALEIYHNLQQLLKREFGIAPSREAAELAREVATLSRTGLKEPPKLEPPTPATQGFSPS